VVLRILLGVAKPAARTPKRAAPNRAKKPAAEVRGDPWLVGWSWLGGGPVLNCGEITTEKALTLPTYLACVRNIAEDVAKLPISLVESLEDGTRRRVIDDPIYALLQDPNPETGSVEFVESLMGSAVGWGNGFAEIVRNGNGEPKQLWYLEPWKVTIRRIGPRQDLIYEHRQPDSTRVILQPENVLHVHGLAFDGTTGYTPAQLLAKSFKAHTALRDFGGAFYENGAAPGVVLTHPGKLRPEAHAMLRHEWETMHGGPDNAGKTAILEEGMKAEALQINPRDAQFLESARFHVEDIARIFRMPPHMVGDLSRGTFSNIEHLSIEYVTNTLMAWIRRLESALRRRVTNVRGPRFSVKIQFEGALRGDTESRFNAYAVGRQWGWLSPNDIRRLEDLPPIAGGDEYLSPLNMVPLGTPPPESEPDPTPEEEAPRELPEDNSRGLLEATRLPLLDAAARLLEKERRAVTNLARGDGSEGRIDRFYGAHVRQLAEALLPSAQAIRTCMDLLGITSAATPEEATLEAASQHVAWSRRELASCGAEGVAAAAAEWPRSRAASLAEYVMRRLCGEEFLTCPSNS
jgi:HK97 family phage portal protein